MATVKDPTGEVVDLDDDDEDEDTTEASAEETPAESAEEKTEG